MAWRAFNKEMHQWGFDSFVTNMDDNHRVLSEYGESIPEGRKVLSFLSCIQLPIMSHVKFSVVGNPTIVASFTLAND